MPVIGVRREDKSKWERRTPITPDIARHLRENHDIAVHVQSSPIRIFSHEEYIAAGAEIHDSLDHCPVVFAVKEIPSSTFRPGVVYVFFSHVIKGQPYNMPMLRRLMELGCTLIDYEKVVDDAGRRLIFFGRHAGLSGMIETLWALGQRLKLQGYDTPLASIRHAHEYHDLAEAKAEIAEIGRAIMDQGLPPAITPLTIGVTGYGNVSRGAWEIIDLLPVRRIEPAQLPEVTGFRGRGGHPIYATTFREEHLVEPREDQERFDCQRYYDCPEGFRGIFERHLPHLNVIVNGIYWDERYPRVVTKDALANLRSQGELSLQVIGDISCDIDGSIECTVKSTDPGQPVFVYHPATGEIVDGIEGEGVAVMAVDILPSELPRDASENFSIVLKEYIPAIARADFSAPFEELALPAPIKRAVIVHRGELTPAYRYLAGHLG